MTGCLVANHHAAPLSELDMRIVRSVPPGGNWRNVPEDVPSRRLEQIRRGARSGGGSRSTYYGRLRGDKPSYTISTYYHRPGNGCTIHPRVDRVLSDREAARLQTFPDFVVFDGPSRARQAQIGNAVPPLLAAQLTSLLPRGTVLDLFSGAGGLSLGATLVGHELVAAIDNNRHALATLGDAHGDMALSVGADLTHPDDRATALSTVEQRLAGRQLDLLMGGPPCQGFSTAGVCAPEDPRNRLLFEFVHFVEHFRPRRVLFENVIGLWFRGRALLADVLARLSALGYTVDHQVLHVEAFGVPQRRRRLVVQGTLAGAPVWPVPWRATSDPSYRELQRQHAGADAPPPFTVDDAIGDLPGETADAPDMLTRVQEPATSTLSGWMRGEVLLEELLPTAVGGMTPEVFDLRLFAA